MVKRFCVLLLVAASVFAQDSDWIHAHPDMVKQSPWWEATLSVPRFLWLTWGELEVKYPPEISSISGPGCMFTDLDSKTQVGVLVFVREKSSQTRATFKALRGHRIAVKCRGYMLKSQAELVQEFPAKDASGKQLWPWCKEAPCIQSIHLNGRD
jgi:hypothetical protein